MIAQRLAPVGTPRHEKIFNRVQKIEGLDGLNPLVWFAIGGLYAAGISAYAGNMDRYTFWTFSRWIQGSVGILIWTLVYVFLLRKQSWFDFSSGFQLKHLILNLLIGLVVFLSGWVHFSINGLTQAVLYLLAFLAIWLVFTIEIDENEDTGKKTIPNPTYRLTVAAVGGVLLLFTMFAGIFRDDPVLSTASIVALPFYIVALFDNHVRHVQRLRFYPGFIFLGFIASREAWFFVIAVIFFYFLRHFYYFRLGIIHPSFGVDHDEENLNTA